MLKHYMDRVKHTKEHIRTDLLQRTFNEFDVETLRLTDAGRHEKYTKMLESPFRFFRGSAYLFYFDHMTTPSIFHTADDFPIWIQGDLHMDNFGAFQNEQGDIVFDINDFDEGYMGSYLYDIIRMCVSIALYTESEGYSPKQQVQLIDTYIRAYVKQLERFLEGKDDPMSLTFTKENTNGPVRKVLKKLEKRKENHLLEDITEVNEDGKRVFAWTEEVESVTDEEREKIHKAMQQYRTSLDDASRDSIQFYAMNDLARKYGTGTASIGLKRYYALVEGERDASGVEDLVLEIKEVRPAVPAYFLTYYQSFWDEYEHQGKRVVGTQKAMHHLQDPYLGYVSMGEEEFYIRERSPYKKKIKQKNYSGMEDYEKTLKIMGKITAKSHSRAGVVLSQAANYCSEEKILAAIKDVETFSDYMTIHAISYKDQVNEDYRLFSSYVRDMIVDK